MCTYQNLSNNYESEALVFTLTIANNSIFLFSNNRFRAIQAFKKTIKKLLKNNK
jgi:hypothetical protein